MSRILFSIMVVFFIQPFFVYSQSKIFLYIQNDTIFSMNIESEISTLYYTFPKSKLPKSFFDVKYRANTFVWPNNIENAFYILKNKLDVKVDIPIYKTL